MSVKNLFKRAINQKQLQYGCMLTTGEPYVAEIAATAGFDWLFIDAEHAPNDVRSILTQLQAIAPYPSHPVVRPVEGDPARIKQLLDIGVQSLLIPMIESAEQAELMVKSVHYPPKGIRGVGAAIARASKWNKVTDYHHQIEQEICLLLQIESVAGLNNLDAILAVDGVDGIFIGPSDLAASMGRIGEPDHQQVQDAITQALSRIKASGKAAGILTTDPALARSYQQQGVTFIAVGIDTLLLSTAMSQLADSYQSTP